MDEHVDNADIDVTQPAGQRIALGASMKLADQMVDQMVHSLYAGQVRVSSADITGEAIQYSEGSMGTKPWKGTRLVYAGGSLFPHIGGKRHSFQAAVQVEYDGGKAWRPKYGEFYDIVAERIVCFRFEEATPGGVFRAVPLEGHMPLLIKD